MNTVITDLDVVHIRSATGPSQDHGDTLLKRFSARPILDEVLDDIGPLPLEALFLGRAEDGLPVLLNLHDPAPGPILVVGDHASGKTDLLRLLAQFAISTSTPQEIQFVVITDRAEEWQERISDAPHCVGVFPGQGADTRRLFQSAAMWIEGDGSPKQSVLILLDGLDVILNWDEVTLAHLFQVLKHGTKKRVWPIVTVNSHVDARLQKWMELFRVKFFAYDLIHQGLKYAGTDNDRRYSNASNAPWFSMKEHGQWIHFWIPDIGF